MRAYVCRLEEAFGLEARASLHYMCCCDCSADEAILEAARMGGSLHQMLL